MVVDSPETGGSARSASLLRRVLPCQVMTHTTSHLAGHSDAPPLSKFDAHAQPDWRFTDPSRFLSPQTIRRPAFWPYADMFCIRPADHPSWLERQRPWNPVAHLPVRGYCTHVCSRWTANAHGFVGLCLRPVMYGEHKPHSDHVFMNCLKGH